ncbi:deoxyribose-phosphate aldolase [Ideonella sp. DXS29W]|uniref:Deoxyribose-phosphate aldolase n=1 Tax=Ideonella lacteola TaxID=2984193 RepID=A0ABU9BX28_9BURK
MNDAELQQAARQALACLDLTRLNDDDTEADIERLCERAHTRHGEVAAVCVWPRLAALARRRAPAGVRVAAVANFPHGEAKPERAQRDVGEIVQAGAQEVDVVLPWQALLDGDTGAVARVLAATRRAADGLTLKVILETGMLQSDAHITEASRIALGEGADFLKTSTGKVPTGATPEAARAMLRAIAGDARRAAVGFKASGGVRTVAEAGLYLKLVTEHLGAEAAAPARFRIGASGLLDDIDAVLSGRASSVSGAGY